MRNAAAAAFVLLLVALVASFARRVAGPVRPNVLLVSIDSLRADHVGANGYERDTTPHLDALGAAGAVFRTAISPSSWTVPAHMTLLTGLPPEAHGVNKIWNRLAPDVVTLAEVLQANGYVTAGFVAGATLRGVHGYTQGFDLYDESVVPPGGRAAQSMASSPAVIGLVERWLVEWADAGRRQPFFAFVHLWDVHYDYAPPPPYDSLFDPTYEGDLDASNFERNKALHAKMPARDRDRLIALYDGEIRFTDEWLGRLFATLDRMQLTTDTIVVVTADHGDEFFEHGLKGHAKTLFDEVIRVPLLIRYPRRVAPRQVIDEQVRLQDVAPTILGLAEISPSDGFGAPDLVAGSAGVDLAPWIAGERADPLPGLPAHALLATFTRLSAIRTQTHKLIVHGSAGKPVMHAFDVRADPHEATPLAWDHRASNLHAAHERWTAFWSRAKEPRAPSLEIAPEHEEQLRALGYLE